MYLSKLKSKNAKCLKMNSEARIQEGARSGVHPYGALPQFRMRIGLRVNFCQPWSTPVASSQHSVLPRGAFFRWPWWPSARTASQFKGNQRSLEKKLCGGVGGHRPPLQPVLCSLRFLMFDIRVHPWFKIRPEIKGIKPKSNRIKSVLMRQKQLGRSSPALACT